jgi:peptidylprolyl isomerase
LITCIGGSGEVSRRLRSGDEYGVGSFPTTRRVDDMSTQTARPDTAESAKRRRQSLAGALTGVAIVVLLAAVFFIVKNGEPDKSPSPAAAAPGTQQSAAAEPSAQGPPPAPTGVETPPALAKEPDVQPGKGTLSKLVITPIVPGTGPAVQKGQTVTANYKLISYKTGEVIDSSWSRGQPFSAPIGVGQVIKGWDEGMLGQKVGSRFQLDIPAALAYGEQQGDLRFVIDILAVQ